MRIRQINILALVILLVSSCIEYDMSYPRILAEFVKLEVEGAEKVRIDPATMTVTIDLKEEADLAQVRVSSVELNDKASFKDGVMPEVLDLRTPYQIMLSTYQDYRWTIDIYT